MWTLIVAIVVGFIAGLIARAIHPGNDKAGFIMTTDGDCRFITGNLRWAFTRSL